MPRVVRAVPLVPILAVVSLIALVPAIAPAQTGPQPAPTAPAPGTAPAPAASDVPPPKPVVPATGYGWSTHPAVRMRGRVHARASASGPSHPEGTVVPGFEVLADGSSRVFVQLPKPVTYSTKAAKGVVTYVLKGVRVDRHNDLNALVTVHFNTPVTSARLVPHGGDLWLVVDLRANVQPSVAMDATKDGGAMLRVEFPKGDYLSGGGPAAPAPAPSSPAPSATPAPADSTPPPATSAPAPASSGFAPSGL